MKQVRLTKAQARKIILHAAGLARRAQFGKGKDAVYKMIEHLGFVQIDTNFVVERAHHHTIAARVPDYRQSWLEELQSDGKIFEFWTYATGYIPMNDFRFSIPVKEAFASRAKSATQAERNLMTKILDRISREGPLSANDFENDRVTRSTGWWDWRPSKLALERLHLDGRLTTTRRRDFRKLYDLTENIIPSDIDTTPPSPQEYARHVISRALQAYGIAYAKEIVYTNRFVKGPVKLELEKMVDEGLVYCVAVAGLKTPLYMLPSYKSKKITLSNDAFILSPFDLLNVFRHRLKDFFDFDYQVECFVPAAKRKYGYFSLPVLIGDKFVARMDCKADRKARTLIINNLHFESVTLTRAMMDKLEDAIKSFAEFNQCNDILLMKTNNRSAVKVMSL